MAGNLFISSFKRNVYMTQQFVFVFRAIVFMALLFIMDFVLGSVMHKLYFSIDNKYSYGILKTKADVIIVGSSRAEHHYIPSILSDSLGLSCFNMGSGGQNIYYQYGVVKSLMDRYTPQIILLDIIPIDYCITGETHNTEKLAALLPFYRDVSGVREVIELRGPLEKYKLISRSYPYNSQISNIIYSYVRKGDNSGLVLAGYIPLKGEMKDYQTISNLQTDYELDPMKALYLNKLKDLCRLKGVKLIMLYSPVFYGKYDESDLLLKDVADKANIDFWSYKTYTPIITDVTLFNDGYHLNNKGAQEYTSLISANLRAIWLNGFN